MKKNLYYKMPLIYCIKSNETDKIYIGSTIKTLEQRLKKHKDHYKEWLKTTTKYCTSYEILKYDDYYIELIEECEDSTRFEKEKYYIKQNKDKIVNKIININRTIDELKEYEKERNIKNRSQLKEYCKQYREINKEELKEKERLKYEKNRELKKAQSKAYYELNKDKINAKRRLNKI